MGPATGLWRGTTRASERPGSSHATVGRQAAIGCQGTTRASERPGFSHATVGRQAAIGCQGTHRVDSIEDLGRTPVAHWGRTGACQEALLVWQGRAGEEDRGQQGSVWLGHRGPAHRGLTLGLGGAGEVYQGYTHKEGLLGVVRVVPSGRLAVYR